MSDDDEERRRLFYPTMFKDSGNALTGTFVTSQPEKKVGNALMPSDRELFEEAMRPPMVDIRPEMRSLAGKMMHHYDVEVRDIAATLLRCVERLETGR